MTYEQLQAAGKIRISGGRWYRLNRLVVRWRLVDPAKPKGVALANAGKLVCKWGHPLPPFQPGTTRRCTVCARESARKSKAKARQKKLALKKLAEASKDSVYVIKPASLLNDDWRTI
jgi:hypothetical protein